MQNGSDNSSRFGARLVSVLMGLALLVGLALAAWISFDAIPDSAWQTARQPAIDDVASPLTRELDDFYQIVFYMAVAVFVLVEGLILYAAFRFRRKPGDPMPKQVHGDNRAEIAWTLAPTLIVLLLAYMGYGVMQQRFVTEYDQDPLVVNATGFQWWWEFDYPEAGFATSTEMVVPVNRPVRVMLESHDVLHSFWVPELAGKYDAVPGARDGGAGQNSISFVAERTGRFEGQCAELCGTQHAGMRFTVIVVEEEEYQAWADAHAEMVSLPELPEDDPETTPNESYGVLDSDSAEVRGYKYFMARCITCHLVDGVNTRVAEGEEIAPERSADTPGPNVTRMAARTFLAGGVVAHTGVGAQTWVREPGTLKIGSNMAAMGYTDAEIDDILTWLYSFKIDDDVMRPVYAAEPRPDHLPPAYEELAAELLADDSVAEADAHGEGE